MYLVIEKHGGLEYASIVTDEDGNNKVFNTIEEAQQEADDCQDAIIVGEDDTLRYVIKEMYEAHNNGGTLTHIQDLIEKAIN